GPEPVPPHVQNAALDALLETITPQFLRIPDNIVELIPPRPPGYYGSRELFKGYTDPAFDPLAAAETAANMTVELLFNSNRVARLVEMEARDSLNLGLAEMIDKVLSRTWYGKVAQGY